MPKLSRLSKLIPVLLIVAVFCAACDVPDISEFTKQSAEMTRGIRNGVKDSGTLIKTASEREDLYSEATRKKLTKNLKDYQSGMKPTVEALDALDAYLEALNALAQANKKSEENSRAAVNAVGSLVTAISGLSFASSAVNVAAGLLTAAEEFRTSKDFKKRVNLAAEIVEGVYLSRDEDGKPRKNEKGQPIFLRTCTESAGDRIVESGQAIKKIVDPKIAALNESQTKTLKPLSPEKRREKLRDWGKLNAAELAQIKQAERQIASYHCGVIDFIKFNIKDLKEINLAVSQSMFRNLSENNRTVLGFYDSIVASDRRVQRELGTILNYGSLVALIRELEATGGSLTTIREAKIRLKSQLDTLFILDGPLRNDVIQAITGCGAGCGNMKRYLEFSLCEDCEPQFIVIVNSITKTQFDRSNGFIERIFETRADSLSERNSKYLEDLKRITPSHSSVVNELNAIQTKRDELDSLLDSSLSALDAWRETHANLRVAVNTKKPLTVAKLTSKVREIWGIINSEPN